MRSIVRLNALQSIANMQGIGHFIGQDSERRFFFVDRGTAQVLWGFDSNDTLIQIKNYDPDLMKHVVRWATHAEITKAVARSPYHFPPDIILIKGGV